jgi:hypothetical protein
MMGDGDDTYRYINDDDETDNSNNDDYNTYIYIKYI